MSRLGMLLLASCLVGCSNGSNNNIAGAEDSQFTAAPQSLRNYELTAEEGSFKTVEEEGVENAFILTLNGLSNALFFTNQGVLDAGSETINDLVNNIWPNEYDTTGPNAVLQYSADGVVHDLSCILNKPVYDESTGLLNFTITYQDGVRPVDQDNLRDVKVIITKNAAEVHPAQWSTILSGNTAVLDVTDGPDEYLLTITGVNEHIFASASAPHRNSLQMTSDDLIRRWDTDADVRPPSASLSYSAPMNAEAGVQVLTLTDPVYDGDRDVLQFTAKSLFGTTSIASGMSVNHPTLSIDGAVGHAFSTSSGNHFSIQYRNSSAEAVTVWLNGAQPPCSQSEATNCAVGGVPDHYTTDWKNMKDAFKASGTHFHIDNWRTKKTREIEVTNRIHLDRGETLRIVPPLDADNNPQWYYSAGGTVQTAGVTGWVTKANVNMPAPMQVNVFEYNLDYPQLTLWADISAVDGLNSNATMTWEGPGCGGPECGTHVKMPRRLNTNIEPNKGNNDGCPHIMVVSGARTCPNPKHYPVRITAGDRPNWVVGSNSFDTQKVSSLYSAIWTSAGSPDGLQMCAAASGLAAPKEAYHIWWATNSVGTGWLKYLQKNTKGLSDVYGWAYDEKKWKPGDKFDKHGNPPDNTSVTPQFSGLMKNDTYLNIDILKVM
jgi:hypothetical protein